MGSLAKSRPFGGRANLVTSAAVCARMVAVVAKAVLNHVAELRTLHPALGRLRPRDQRRVDRALHPGAERVYKELGLIE